MTLFIPFSALLSMAFAAFLWWRVSHVKVAAEAPMTGETRALLLEVRGARVGPPPRAPEAGASGQL